MTILNRRQCLEILGGGLLANPGAQLLSALASDPQARAAALPAHPATAGTNARPLLAPAPRHLAWNDTMLGLTESCSLVATTGAEQQVAQVLQEELSLLYHVRARIVRETPVGQPHILLALTSTQIGTASSQKATDRALWEATENKAEAYVLEVNSNKAMILADSPRGLMYGIQTLLQLVIQPDSGTKQIWGVNIVDYPQLEFRGLHICVFPESDLEIVRRHILMAARFKYNAIVLEFWASLKSKKWPQTAYDHAYTPAQIRPLIELGRSRQMEMIPALNSGGHQAGMRAASGEHVVLDRFPELKDLFVGPYGWSLCLSNPAIYPFLFDRYDELIELFGQPQFFHVGIDEAWGSRGYTPSARCWTDEPHTMIAAHLRKIHDYLSERKIQTLMWHDMFVEKNTPGLGAVSPANSVPPINSYLALDSLPKDVIIAAWNYSVSNEWPVPKYFQDKGHRVLVSTWKNRANTISLLNTAKKLNLMGLLATIWDSEIVVFPSIGQAGVLAWTAPEFNVKTIPFDYWLEALRTLQPGDQRSVLKS